MAGALCVAVDVIDRDIYARPKETDNPKDHFGGNRGLSWTVIIHPTRNGAWPPRRAARLWTRATVSERAK